jgi:hypothetical protein
MVKLAADKIGWPKLHSQPKVNRSWGLATFPYRFNAKALRLVLNEVKALLSSCEILEAQDARGAHLEL